MARAFIWLLRIFTGMVVLLAVGLALVYWFASRSLPDYDRDYRLSGIAGPVEIVRDNANVPHIFGETDEDVFFALGFAHAQDRLWQMTMLRRTAQGRLSELFGARTLKTDQLIRRLDLYTLATRAVEAQDERTRKTLEAYARGVNAWIETVNTEALGRGAPEFFLFSNEIAPWQPADSLAIGKLMALQLTGKLEEEVLRARVSLRLEDDQRLADILPDAPGAAVNALPEYASLFPGRLQRADLSVDEPRDPLSPFPERDLSGASNAWAAAPSRSATDSSLLANDPHLGLTAPSVWYLARLELSTGGVIGGTFPGTPLVLVGRNAKLGWGMTSSYLDDQDLFIEEVNPDNPEEYRTPEGWKKFRTRRSVIRIKDAAPVTITLRWTDNGPVLPGSLYGIGDITPRGAVAALSWTALNEGDTTASGFRALMAAQSVDEGIEAGALMVAPAQNMVLADRERIAMQSVGAMPRRAANSQNQGRMPAPGWLAANRWDGMLPYTANPRFLDPEGGIVGNTNNKIIDRPFPLHFSFDWGDTQRVQRWQKLMQSRRVHTRESFIETQLDTVSVTARNLLPLIARDLWQADDLSEKGTVERRRKQALDLLSNWNGEMNEHLPEPLIYAAWVRDLQSRLSGDELGPLSGAFTRPDPLFIERVFRNIGGASSWCDVLQSTQEENCTQIARISLDAALVELSDRYGENMESWRWGDAHQARQDHPVLGNIPILSWFVNIRQSTSGGDNTLRRGMTGGSPEAPYANVHAAGYRGVYDFADPDSSVFIISTGQSGHPLSRFYDDMGELWRRGEYIPMSLDPELARAAAVGITTLRPRP